MEISGVNIILSIENYIEHSLNVRYFPQKLPPFAKISSPPPYRGVLSFYDLKIYK